GSAVAAVVGACHPGGLRRGVVVPVREERVFYVHALHDTVRGEGEGVAGTIDDVDDLGLVAVAAARQGSSPSAPERACFSANMMVLLVPSTMPTTLASLPLSLTMPVVPLVT